MSLTTREILDSAFKSLGITQKDAARAIGCSAQSLGQKLIRGSLRSDDFLRLLDTIGIDVTFTNRNQGRDLTAHVTGHGRRVRGMSDGVQYDTAMSEALSNNFYEDGEHEYQPDGTAIELYVDSNGRYFAAEYTEEGKDRVRSVPSSMALAFIEKYGTDIEKKQN